MAFENIKKQTVFILMHVGNVSKTTIQGNRKIHATKLYKYSTTKNSTHIIMSEYKDAMKSTIETSH